jgi:hypothetical protein
MGLMARALRRALGAWCTIAATLIWCACAPRYPLHDVPIIGGSSAQRVAVRAELLRLSDVMLDPPVLSRVEFTSIEGAGTYRTHSDSVRLSERLSPSSVETALRHEVCHALFEQNNVTALGKQAAEDLVARVGWKHDTPTREVDGEAFAIACGWGELGLHTISTECGAADASLVGIAAHVGPLAYRSAHASVDVPRRELALRLPSPERVDTVLCYDNQIATFHQANDEPPVHVDIVDEAVTDEPTGWPFILPEYVDTADLHLGGVVLASGVQTSGKGVAAIRPDGARVTRIVARPSVEAPWQFVQCEHADTVAVGVLTDDRVWFVESSDTGPPRTFEVY